MAAPIQGHKKEKPPLHEYPEKVLATSILSHMGISSATHSGIHTIAENTVALVSGNLALFVNYKTGEIDSIVGPEDGGVGAIAVHPSKARFALCEKSLNGPRIAIYEYPTKKVTHTMKNGAVQGFSACAFNPDGRLLATVATDPDYTLTVWNWEQQSIVLRNKAFSSDVYSVTFSPFSESMLVTTGLGHLKIWDMASTFTGLKLQGTVGKFGKVEISDISSCVAFPDGKILSGSEAGSLLLWEANLVKCELMRFNADSTAATPAAATTTAKKALKESADAEENADEEADEEDSKNNTQRSVGLLPCHEGNIEVVKLIEDSKIVMTAGHDGWVRYWSMSEADLSEPSGTSHVVGIKLLKELFLGQGVKAKSVTLSSDKTHWVLLDRGGSIRTFPRWSYTYITGPSTAAPPPEAPSKALIEFFDGPVSATIASPTDHSVVVGGVDGTIRLYDTTFKTELYRSAFDASVSHLQFYPKEVDSTGTIIFAAFGNGVVRILRKCRDGFEVLASWRPHSARLVAAAISADATQVYTAAADGTAFYTKLTNNGLTAVPYGFCELPDKVIPSSLEWSAEGDVCFFGFSSGMLLAVKPPTEIPNHDETFQFPISFAGVGYRQKLKPPQKEKKISINPNDVEESSSDEDDEEEDQGPWGIQAIKRLPSTIGGYVVALDKEELAYVFDLSIRYADKLGPPPIPPTGVDPPGRVEEPGVNVAYRNCKPLNVAVSQDQKTLLVTFGHGEVILRDLATLRDKKPLVRHARQYHDSVDGHLNGLAILFDGSALVTGGADGLIITQQIDGDTPPSGKVTLTGLPKADISKKHGTEVSKAVIARSVEEQRRVDDEEAAEALAEGKRSVIKKKIAAVHREYLEILDSNEEAEGGRKLTEAELTLDPELMALLDHEKSRRVAEASIEHSWKIAFKEQLLKQLREAFVDTMTYDRFAVKSFDKTFSVASLRTPAFTEAQRAKLEPLQRIIEQKYGVPADTNNIELAMIDDDRPLSMEGDGERSPAGSPVGGQLSSSPEDEENANDPDLGPDATGYAANATMNQTSKTDTLGTNKALKSQLDKAEERKRERLERKKGLEELMGRKPKPGDVDPAVEAEIIDATAQMADEAFKPVPTAERKARQLILLEHSIRSLRAKFNEKLLALRDMKRHACEQLNEDRHRLAEIIVILNLDESELPSAFELTSEEEPEKRFDASEQFLRKWARERAKEQRRLEAQQRANKGFGADLAGGEGNASESESDNEGGLTAAAKRASRLSGGHRESTFARKPSLLSLKEKLEMDLKVRLDNVRMGELEEEEAIIQRETLMYERGRLIRRMEAAKKSYDDKLLEILKERMSLEADLCLADMRTLLLFREYRMLLNFKKNDEELEGKYAQKKTEDDDINAKARNIRKKADAIQKKQSDATRTLEMLMKEAEEHIATSFPLQDHPYLKKVWTRKIKRAKADDQILDDDDGATSSDEDEVDETVDDFEEIRPATCDEEPWLHLLRLRELKLDAEDSFGDAQAEKDALEREHKKTQKLKNQIDIEIAACAKAVHDFQIEKQHQLNLLETIVVLKLSQVMCLDDNKHVPSDLQKAPVIVFTEAAINRLRSRIAELADEKHDLTRRSEQLGRSKQALLRRKSKRQLEHSDWEQRVSAVQLLKFGQKVDLEALENLAVDRETEELKQQLKMEEIKWERELRRQDNKVTSLRHDHQNRIGENTMLLKDLGNMREEQQTLEHALTTSTQKIVGKMAGGSKVATAADRAQLKDLVVRQQQEIDMLGNEVTMLRRKGGHVYTPVIQRLAQQEQQQAFNNSMPVPGASLHIGGQQHSPDLPQHPSSAPSGQQLGQHGGVRHGGAGLSGLSASASASKAPDLVVRPSTLASARQPAPVAKGKRPANVGTSAPAQSTPVASSPVVSAETDNVPTTDAPSTAADS